MRACVAALVLALLLAPAAAAREAPAPGEAATCTAANGRVVFSGPSEALGFCLDSAGSAMIAELRINSQGGDAARTLADMERYADRIDLVVVDGLCASSCANYVLPVAQRLIVPRDAFVMLHGAIEVEQVRAYLNAQRPQLRAQGVPARELDGLIARSMAPIEASARAQAAFAARLLSCDDWLRPQDNSAVFANPEARGVIVTDLMARRCLKRTRVESFWAVADLGALSEAMRAENMVLAQ